jgi:hypothetical protein
MGYIGQEPTAVALDGDDLANDIITLAKMASGTDGNIISYDASGNPVAIATGSSGEVLTSGGAGAAPSFAAAGVAGISSSANANAIVISADEEVNLPGQPAFLVRLNTTSSNVTGAGTLIQVPFDTEVFDIGGNFASNVFTAPITGIYYLSTEIIMGGITASLNRRDLQIVASNRTYYMQMFGSNHGVGYVPMSVSGLVDMDAGDTAQIKLLMAGESSDVCDVTGDGALLTTSFSGILVA